MYNKNKSGLNMLPCSTLTVTGFGSEDMLLIDVTAVRDDKYERNQLTTEVENPRFCNFKISSS